MKMKIKEGMKYIIELYIKFFFITIMYFYFYFFHLLSQFLINMRQFLLLVELDICCLICPLKS